MGDFSYEQKITLSELLEKFHRRLNDVAEIEKGIRVNQTILRTTADQLDVHLHLLRSWTQEMHELVVTVHALAESERKRRTH